MRNRAGYIIEAIRKNYQDLEIQKQRTQRAEKAKQKELEDLTTEYNLKRNNIVRQRLLEHPTPLTAYQKGAWSPQKSTPSLPKNSAKTASHLSSRPSKTKKHKSSQNDSSIETTNGQSAAHMPRRKNAYLSKMVKNRFCDATQTQ